MRPIAGGRAVKVVVVGAGYAGTIAANRLAKKCKQAEITVINPREEFVERVRLHEEVAGSGGAATPLATMLQKGVGACVGTVERIGEGLVTLTDGSKIEFDRLVLAVGSTAAPMPGTVPVGTWEGARQARAALDRIPGGGVVTVIGGGLTGVETASEVADARPDLNVRLLGGSVAESLSPGARARVRKGLERLGVEIVEDTVTAVSGTAAEGGGVVRLRSGSEFAADLTLWAVVGHIPELARHSGLPVNDEGRAVVDEFLRSPHDERIFVVGDCAAVPGARLCCATASPQGAHAADTLARIIRGRKPKPYSMGYAGQVVSLGRRDGVLQMSRRDDTVCRIFIAGRPGALFKEWISSYAKYGSRTAIYTWLPGTKRARALDASG
jgi:NADH dehydrogenase FAD-containing subunit